MVNVDMLRGKIVERRMTVESVAESIGVTASTLYRRMSGGGSAFTVDEVDALARTLCLTADELSKIFFAQFVA